MFLGVVSAIDLTPPFVQVIDVDANGGNSSSWNRTGTNVHLANSGDNVGIGTTTPQNTLNVIGVANFTSESFVDNSAICTSANGYCNQSSSLSNSTAWNRTGTNVHLANASDLVGIGGVSGGYKLEVIGTSTSSANAEFAGGAETAY